MVIVDTSVWVDHLNRTDEGLQLLLLDGMVVAHPFVIGEIACGRLHNRTEVLRLLRALPSAPVVTESEYHHFVDSHRLWGMGLGFVDVHILASAAVSEHSLLSRDKAMRIAAERLRLAHLD